MNNKDLQDIKKELETQDSSWTADPIFIVYDIEKVPTSSDYSDLTSFISDGSEYDEEAVKNYLKDDEIDFDEDNWEDIAEEHGFERWYYLEKPRYQAVFFTRKSAQEFIDKNHYHFNKPYIYVHSLWRNYEMQGIRNALLNGEFAQAVNSELEEQK